jgi:hypothetical protein
MHTSGYSLVFDRRCQPQHLCMEKEYSLGEFAADLEDERTRPSDSIGPHGVRTKDNPIGITDAGLPSGIQPNEVGGIAKIKPDPQKVENKS